MKTSSLILILGWVLLLLSLAPEKFSTRLFLDGISGGLFVAAIICRLKGQ